MKDWGALAWRFNQWHPVSIHANGDSINQTYFHRPEHLCSVKYQTELLLRRHAPLAQAGSAGLGCKVPKPWQEQACVCTTHISLEVDTSSPPPTSFL